MIIEIDRKSPVGSEVLLLCHQLFDTSILLYMNIINFWFIELAHGQYLNILRDVDCSIPDLHVDK
jgi:hypothetical protein